MPRSTRSSRFSAPRLVAEVPETLAPACELFSASGFAQESVLVDYVLQGEENDAREVDGRLLIPVTVDDVAANGLIEEADTQVCWERSAETFTARKDEIAGLAVASDEHIEAYLFYVKHRDSGSARLKQLLARFLAGGMGTFRFPKVHPEEISKECLEALGFRPVAAHRLYAARARAS